MTRRGVMWWSYVFAVAMLARYISDLMNGWSNWVESLPQSQQQIIYPLIVVALTAIGAWLLKRFKNAKRRIAAQRAAALELAAARARLNPEATLLEDLQRSDNAWGQIAEGLRSIEHIGESVQRIFGPLEAAAKGSLSVEEKIQVVSSAAKDFRPYLDRVDSLAPKFKMATEDLLKGHMIMLMVGEVKGTSDLIALGERRKVFVGGIPLFQRGMETCLASIAAIKPWHGHVREMNELIIRALPAFEQMKDSNGVLKTFAEQTIENIDEKIRR